MDDNIQINITGRLTSCLQKKIDKTTHLVEVHFSSTSTKMNLYCHVTEDMLISEMSKFEAEESEKGVNRLSRENFNLKLQIVPSK
jgi:hypothetical protein